MSDIEDYTYSPYDDLEEILWDADPTPELADDLAEHAVHSPVYQEEDAVKNEMSEYYSDWEYYSDDYMDDDPTLLRKSTEASPAVKDTVSAVPNSRRGKKRKLVETIDTPPSGLDEVKLLTRGIKGTIWAQPTGQKTPAYKDGQEDKVALMKNWKDIFAFKNNGWNQSPGQTQDDESWANDMSLADMGLRHVQRQPSFDPNARDAGAEIEEDDELADEDLHEEHDEQIMSSKEGPRPNDINPRHVVLNDEGGGGSSQVSEASLRSEGSVSQSGVLDEDEIPRKRRRVKADLPSPPDSSETVIIEADEPEVTSQTSEYRKRDGHKRDETSMANGTGVSRVQTTDIREPGPRRENKRKATEELDEADLANSNATNRAKRVASKATRNSRNVNSTAFPATNTRSTH